jgi:hypothetical protein
MKFPYTCGSSSGSDQLPPPPSIMMDLASPEEEESSPRSRPSLRKAQFLYAEDLAKAGIESPISWDTDPEAMRARERRNKSNADRPSLRRSPTRKEVAIQLDFSEAQPKGNEAAVEETLLEGEVIAELAASVSRAPRRKAHPPVAARSSAQERDLRWFRSWRRPCSEQKTKCQLWTPLAKPLDMPGLRTLATQLKLIHDASVPRAT